VVRLGYIRGVVLQDLIFCFFFLVRIEKIFKNQIVGNIAMAGIFAAIHIPNPILAPVTFLGGLAISYAYRRTGKILPIIVAHYTIGMAIAFSVPNTILHNMRVGLSYWTWHG